MSARMFVLPPDTRHQTPDSKSKTTLNNVAHLRPERVHGNSGKCANLFVIITASATIRVTNPDNKRLSVFPRHQLTFPTQQLRLWQWQKRESALSRDQLQRSNPKSMPFWPRQTGNPSLLHHFSMAKLRGGGSDGLSWYVKHGFAAQVQTWSITSSSVV
jgi:hypothetical protein